ncbi:NAD(P)/FAD-dependent oxidoreductase [Solitalea koreensis]|uniref:Glycine/D-amino acid oxidase n=1 Tax=Solitalea koreensis TaxID=543615 RepID=A0A521D165_9SPHI|nr:FAD-dependent oxidoreductase [Solitalea koreensis]SMO65429.1 Glycine/D-amino acid oxidase [Solitalea koreensis]
MLSYWEQTSFMHYNYIIIGSGIVGLSTACCIKEKNPDATVLVLERGIFPTGASTKNAGFACIGNVGEMYADLKLIGEEKLTKLTIDRWEGLQLLRSRIGDAKMDFQRNSGYELVLNDDTYHYELAIEKINDMMEPYFQCRLYSERKDLIQGFGLNPKMVKTIIQNPIEGQIDTGKMMNALLDYAYSLKIRVLTGCEVTEFNETPDCVEINVKNPLYGADSNLQFTCNQLAVCTNAFSKRFFPNADVEPGRGQVVCTSVIPELKIKGTFQFTEGYYYFRNINGRVLFGGARNIDYDYETTNEFGLTPIIQEKLEFYLREMILPGVDFTIENRWSGIMAFGKEITPEIIRYGNRIAAGFRFNGMGVALGSKVAKELTEMLTESN